MTPVTAHWLHERGLLHGARLMAVRHTPRYLEIDISDEWAAERGLTMPKGEQRPATLCFFDAAVTGLFAAGMTLSEIAARGKTGFHLIFTDKGAATIQAGRAMCRPLRR